MRVNAKFGTGTVVSVNGTLVEANCAHSTLNVRILSSTSVLFTLTEGAMPILALV